MYRHTFDNKLVKHRIKPLEFNAIQVGLDDLIDSLELSIAIEKADNDIEYIKDLNEKLTACKLVKDKLTFVENKIKENPNYKINITTEG